LTREAHFKRPLRGSRPEILGSALYDVTVVPVK
jgi:hypothetical protein